jgi:1,4-alpha-glucan branching enzyme
VLAKRIQQERERLAIEVDLPQDSIGPYMQSSDWAFIMRTGPAVSYATRRVNEHILRFNRPYDGLSAGQVNDRWMAEIEARDTVFPDLDYRSYAT